MTLHELIRTHRDRIIAVWREQARQVAAGESMPPRELLDTLPVYLDELAASLEAASTGEPLPATQQVAATHGQTRLQIGFAPHEVVREYALLRNGILQVAHEQGYAPPPAELIALDSCLFASIAASIAAYVREHDAVLQRQANEHLAFLAHELRTPLSAARIGIELLRRERAGDERLEHVSAVVSRNLSRLTDRLDNALTELRLRTPRAAHLETFRADELLRELIADAEALAEASDVGFDAQLEPMEVSADPRLLRSALFNLIVNAIKFSRRGGTVTVRLRPIEGRARFEVEDECGGLPPGAAERLFDPFVQLGPDRSGFGLGLAIARQAVEAHGGNLADHDLQGKGCVFLLEIPASASAA